MTGMTTDDTVGKFRRKRFMPFTMKAVT